MRKPERVTRLAGTDHGVRRAARALGIRAGRVEPEPERHADGIGTCTQEGHGAVDAATHRDRDPTRARRGADHLRERVRHGIGGQGLARDRRRLEQRSARRAGEPFPARPLPRCARRRRRDARTQRRRRARSHRSPPGASIHGSAATHRESVGRRSAGANLPQGHSRVPDVTLAAEHATSWCRLRANVVPSLAPGSSRRACAQRRACRADRRRLRA